ncbi:hypothetical protein HA466_0092650 [Hirschfeldia incana]|nr:hypothetical protein HA466_0092650 [Hirschfeldia incana]
MKPKPQKRSLLLRRLTTPWYTQRKYNNNLKIDQAMAILATLAAKEQCLVDLILYTTGEREIQDDNREEHKYGESLGKKQREVSVGNRFVMLLDSLFLSFGIESFIYAQNNCDPTLLFISLDVLFFF